MAIKRRNTQDMTSRGALPPTSKYKGVIDGDCIKYRAASLGEKRYIKVSLPGEKEPRESLSRTDFYGRGKKISGELSKINAQRELEGLTLFTKEDCVIEDHTLPGDIETCNREASRMIFDMAKASGVSDFEVFLGKGDSFRVGLSTLKEYKGSRKSLVKSPNLPKVIDYLESKFNPKIITGIETDDYLVMRSFAEENTVIIGEDKDFYGQPVLFFNINKPEEGIVDCDCFGKLWIETKSQPEGSGQKLLAWQMLTGKLPNKYKQYSELMPKVLSPEEAAAKLRYCRTAKSLHKTLGGEFETFLEAISKEPYGSFKGNVETKVRGYGRLFLYWQMLAGDASDDYKASYHSHKDLGDMGAYHSLVDCSTDKEALDTLIDEFRELYPSSSQQVKFHQWDYFVPINWYYVFNEQFQMARMKRWEGDDMSASQWYSEYSQEQ